MLITIKKHNSNKRKQIDLSEIKRVMPFKPQGNVNVFLMVDLGGCCVDGYYISDNWLVFKKDNKKAFADGLLPDPHFDLLMKGTGFNWIKFSDWSKS